MCSLLHNQGLVDTSIWNDANTHCWNVNKERDNERFQFCQNMCKVRLTLRDKQLSGWKIFCDYNSNNYDDNSDDDDNNTNDDEDDDDDDDDSDDDVMMMVMIIMASTVIVVYLKEW